MYLELIPALLLTVSSFILNSTVSSMKICDKYEVGTSNPSLLSLHYQVVGLYKLNPAKNCNGRPTYKHVLHDRYLYVQTNGSWIIGDITGYTMCTNWAYLYHPELTANSQSPPTDIGWRYWDYRRRHWRLDDQLKLSCICKLIQIKSNSTDTVNHQPEIFGRYRINGDNMCNNRVTYKHIKNDRFIYVDGFDRWVISNQNELAGKGRNNPCTHWSYAYHMTQPSPYIPGETGWHYKTSKTHKWFHDHTFNVACMCELYHVSTSNRQTKKHVKNHLLGYYKITDDIMCNDRPTFKHILTNLYLYMDLTGDWMISHASDVFGTGRRKIKCDSMGFAFNPVSRESGNVPTIYGWRYFSFKKNVWKYDPQMKVKCV